MHSDSFWKPNMNPQETLLFSFSFSRFVYVVRSHQSANSLIVYTQNNHVSLLALSGFNMINNQKLLICI